MLCALLCCVLCRFQFVWQTCWYDLHDGISTIIHEFITENKAMFDQQRSIHVVLVLIMVGGVMGSAHFIG